MCAHIARYSQTFAPLVLGCRTQVAGLAADAPFVAPPSGFGLFLFVLENVDGIMIRFGAPVISTT